MKGNFLFYEVDMSAKLQLGGFVPAPDQIIEELGLVTACVYGKIWRYEQMIDGECNAAQERIADELGIHPQTLRSHIEKLIDGQYIIDKTPGRRNAPHSYETTEKLVMSIQVVKNSRPGSEKFTSRTREIHHEERESIKETDNDSGKIFRLHENLTGAIPQMLIQDLENAAKSYPMEWIEKAYKIAAKNNARKWSYVLGCLENMRKNGVDWVPGKQSQTPSQPPKQTPPPPEVPAGTQPPPEFYALRERIHQAAKAEQEARYAVS